MDKFLEELSYLNYNFVWRIINPREATDFPVTEGRLYVIGSRIPDRGIQIPESEFTDKTLSFGDFISCTVKNDWYYKVILKV